MGLDLVKTALDLSIYEGIILHMESVFTSYYTSVIENKKMKFLPSWRCSSLSQIFLSA